MPYNDDYFYKSFPANFCSFFLFPAMKSKMSTENLVIKYIFCTPFGGIDNEWMDYFCLHN